MKDFVIYTKKVFQSTICTLIISVLSWLVLPYEIFFQGLFLGMAVSLINGFITKNKTEKITEMALTKRRGRVGAGTLSRMILSVFAIYLSMKFPAHFSLTGVFTGLFTVQFFTVIFALASYFRNRASYQNLKRRE